MYSMGPDIHAPSFPLCLYRIPSSVSPYAVAIPMNADTHIQKIAPGPPASSAVATPAILPVPMVAASAVQAD